MRLPTGSSVATTGIRSSARPAREMGDMRRQVSWLAAQTLPPAFPTSDQTDPGQWHMWQKLAAYSCGGSPGITFAETRFSARAPDSHFHRIPLTRHRNRHETYLFRSDHRRQARHVYPVAKPLHWTGSSTDSLSFTIGPPGVSIPRTARRTRNLSPLLKNVNRL